ncbi:MAG: Trm112 family protein [Pseudomonadales bacterium]
MDERLLSILACPICKGELKFEKAQNELICRFDGLAFPVRDGIPVMLEGEARTLSADERLDK